MGSPKVGGIPWLTEYQYAPLGVYPPLCSCCHGYLGGELSARSPCCEHHYLTTPSGHFKSEKSVSLTAKLRTASYSSLNQPSDWLGLQIWFYFLPFFSSTYIFFLIHSILLCWTVIFQPDVWHFFWYFMRITERKSTDISCFAVDIMQLPLTVFQVAFVTFSTILLKRICSYPSS